MAEVIKEIILTPIGRLVQGSLYEPTTTDMENRPLVYKSGDKIGQPRSDYYFALAIEKGSETHWAETVWGALIWKVGHAAFPGGHANKPNFAWKVKDGDSDIPNSRNRKPKDCEGFPGHWILQFSRPQAPQVCNATGSEHILEPDFVKLGDYVQVFGDVKGNGSPQQPGVFLNHVAVAFSHIGQRIIAGVDIKSVGFGQAPLPNGVAIGMAAGNFTPPAAPSAPPVTPAAPPPPAAVAPPPPHTAILTPPPAPAPVRVMTDPSKGTYEAWIASGWDDAALIQHGHMLP